MKYLFLFLIRIYQMTFSKLIPPDTCRFYPTCSHYGYEAIKRYGIFRGGWMAFWRICRCNPYNQGGIDYVPESLDRIRGIIINVVGMLIVIFLIYITFFI
jgi:hypothetical protein